MQVKQSSLLQSAVKKEQWPQSELPELIMVGRSNAGKSSFINALCNRKNLAYVGKQPGKTRILNFFLINKDYVLDYILINDGFKAEKYEVLKKRYNFRYIFLSIFGNVCPAMLFPRKYTFYDGVIILITGMIF